MTTEGADPPEGSVDEDEAVHVYLGALEAARTARGGFPDPETFGSALSGSDMVDDREGLEAVLAEETPGSDANVAKLEDDFVKAAPGYAQRHGITYDGWRNAGVDAEVLARAGIPTPDE